MGDAINYFEHCFISLSHFEGALEDLTKCEFTLKLYRGRLAYEYRLVLASFISYIQAHLQFGSLVFILDSTI